MKTYVKTYEEIHDLKIKSKQKFGWDFDAELKKIIESSEESIRKNIIPKYWVEYTEFWNFTVKIKINDTTQMINKLIVCNFNYKQIDLKYWYIHPEFSSTEKWQKTRKYPLGKFSITDTDEIIKVFTENLIEIIEEF
jgi:hypothetical protein